MKIVPQMVRLAVYPDVLTEESVDVPVTAINVPDNMVLRTFPSKVAVDIHHRSQPLQNHQAEPV